MTTITNTKGIKLERLGTTVIRYGLAIVLLWVGFLKFTAYEAEAVHGLATHSPFLAWLANRMSVQSFSDLLGAIEIIFGILIAIKPLSPKISFYGSAGAIVMFLITLSFVLSTPGVWQPDYGFPYLSGNPGQFLAKDILLLGAAIYTAGDSLKASQEVF